MVKLNVNIRHVAEKLPLLLATAHSQVRIINTLASFTNRNRSFYLATSNAISTPSLLRCYSKGRARDHQSNLTMYSDTITLQILRKKPFSPHTIVQKPGLGSDSVPFLRRYITRSFRTVPLRMISSDVYRDKATQISADKADSKNSAHESSLQNNVWPQWLSPLLLDMENQKSKKVLDAVIKYAQKHDSIKVREIYALMRLALKRKQGDYSFIVDIYNFFRNTQHPLHQLQVKDPRTICLILRAAFYRNDVPTIEHAIQALLKQIENSVILKTPEIYLSVFRDLFKASLSKSLIKTFKKREHGRLIPTRRFIYQSSSLLGRYEKILLNDVLKVVAKTNSSPFNEKSLDGLFLLAAKAKSCDTLFATLDLMAQCGYPPKHQYFLLLAQNFIRKVEFVTGATSLLNLPPATVPEVAFVGRSNVGKSSLVNMICNRTAIAKTSNTPGKTQQFNYFAVNQGLGEDEFYIVDLPGVGYAEVSQQLRSHWKSFMQSYFTRRTTLRVIFHLIDSRYGPQPEDKELMRFMSNLDYKTRFDYVIAMTKVDKVHGGELKTSIVKKTLETLADAGCHVHVPIIETSAKNKLGRDGIWKFLRHVVS